MSLFLHIKLLIITITLQFQTVATKPDLVSNDKETSQRLSMPTVQKGDYPALRGYFEKNGSWIAVLLVGTSTIIVNLLLAYRNSKNSLAIMRLQIIAANEVKLNQDWVGVIKNSVSEFLMLSTSIHSGRKILKDKDGLLVDINKMIHLRYFIELSLGNDSVS